KSKPHKKPSNPSWFFCWQNGWISGFRIPSRSPEKFPGSRPPLCCIPAAPPSDPPALPGSCPACPRPGSTGHEAEREDPYCLPARNHYVGQWPDKSVHPRYLPSQISESSSAHQTTVLP